VTDSIPLRRRDVELRALLSSALEPLIAQARMSDVDLRIEAAPGLPVYANVDAEKVAWAVATLVGNALRHVRSGSRLRPGGSIRVKLSYDAERGEIVISVKDDGSGIPKEKLATLFEHDGGHPHAVGLGLRLIDDVAAAHGGTVSVDSQRASLDQGTTVTLRLPHPGAVGPAST
jgi:two-component system sensor histidine kinase VicK